jgi:hypothetical protein
MDFSEASLEMLYINVHSDSQTVCRESYKKFHHSLMSKFSLSNLSEEKLVGKIHTNLIN